MQRRILICEDEPALRELMRASLVGDYAFAEARDVPEARELASSLQPDLVVLDVMLPGRHSGLDLLRELRADPELERLPVIVVSAWASEADREAAADAGADAFLAKPFDPDHLGSLAASLLTDGN